MYRPFLPLYALIPESTETPAPVKTAILPGLKNAAIRSIASAGGKGGREEGIVWGKIGTEIRMTHFGKPSLVSSKLLR